MTHSVSFNNNILYLSVAPFCPRKSKICPISREKMYVFKKHARFTDSFFSKIGARGQKILCRALKVGVVDFGILFLMPDFLLKNTVLNFCELWVKELSLRFKVKNVHRTVLILPSPSFFLSEKNPKITESPLHPSTGRHKCIVSKAIITSIKLVTCGVCSKTIRRDGLMRHMQTHREPAETCQFCPAKFHRKELRDDHVRRKHTKVTKNFTFLTDAWTKRARIPGKCSL